MMSNKDIDNSREGGGGGVGGGVKKNVMSVFEQMPKTVN